MIIISYRHRDITQHVTILTATEHRTINDTASDSNFNIFNVREFVEMFTLIALSGTEEVTDNRVIQNLLQGTWHTNRTACHRHLTFTLYVGNLVATIDVRQNMTSGNNQFGITFHQTC